MSLGRWIIVKMKELILSGKIEKDLLPMLKELKIEINGGWMSSSGKKIDKILFLIENTTPLKKWEKNYLKYPLLPLVPMVHSIFYT